MVLDQGGHATRGLVFEASGNIICHVESAITTIQQGDLIVEHDAEQLINSVWDVLEQISLSLGERFAEIKAAGLATQRSSFVCWDKQTGTAFTPIISWQDRRTADEIHQYDKHVEKIHEKTGLYLNPHYGASKINWCFRNYDALKTALEKDYLCIGPLASFILFHILKNNPFKIDPANASRTLLMCHDKLDWDEFLLSIFAVPVTCLPRIENTKFNYGSIQFKHHEIPLRICTGDQSAAIYGAGAPSSSELFVNIGTGAFVQNCVGQAPDLKGEKLLVSVVFSDESKIEYVVEGTVNGAGRALIWLAEQTGIEHYEEFLDVWSEEYVNPPIFLNGVSGVGSPFWIARFESRFIGSASIEAQFVGVLESIIFLIYSNLLAMLNIGIKPGSIQISGGLSRSNAICQKLSDLSKLSVNRANDTEATAKGVFYLLSNQVDTEAKTERHEFFPTENSLLEARYKQWRAEINSVHV